MRLGASPEDIAAETGWSLDRVQRYADQILIERGYVAERAQDVELRTVDGPMSLGEAALGTVLSEGLDDRDLEWDSWRRPDGRWVVVASVFTDDGEIRASWLYDTTGRTVHAQDEAARWLMGASDDDLDQVMAQQTVILPTAPPGRPRLVSIAESAPEPAPRPEVRVSVTRADAHAGDAADGGWDDDSWNGQAHDEPWDDANLDDDDGILDASRPTERGDAVAARHPGSRRSVAPPPAAGPRPVTPRPASTPMRPAGQSARTSTPPAQPTAAPQPASPPAARRSAKGRGKRRASVPTWDEILFGATRNDDA